MLPSRGEERSGHETNRGDAKCRHGVTLENTERRDTKQWSTKRIVAILRDGESERTPDEAQARSACLGRLVKYLKLTYRVILQFFHKYTTRLLKNCNDVHNKYFFK